MKVLSRSFYNRPPEIVAKDLLGKLLVRKLDGRMLSGVIVETEAYLSTGDSAAHGFKGKNKRNQSLYKESGHAYVHSMHRYNLLDVVTEDHEIPSSVLIRAIEPVEGIEKMKALRKVESLENLTNGPGKIGVALSITRALDGIDMTVVRSGLFIIEGEKSLNARDIVTSERIGISTAKEMPLRFYYRENSVKKIVIKYS